MSTKRNPGTFDCHAAAELDEPIFTLRGRDRHAAALVHLWVAMRSLEPHPNEAKLNAASECASQMAEYHDEVHPGSSGAGLDTLARALALLADRYGAVITIDQVPLRPLSMGNYLHRTIVSRRHSPGPKL